MGGVSQRRWRGGRVIERADSQCLIHVHKRLLGLLKVIPDDPFAESKVVSFSIVLFFLKVVHFKHLADDFHVDDAVRGSRDLGERQQRRVMSASLRRRKRRGVTER